LAGTPAGACGLLPAVDPGRVRADQARRLPERPDPRSGRAARGPGARAAAGGGRPEMTAFLTAYMAPLMFCTLVVFLLLGYPVAFSLAALGLSFAFVGIELG